ncbi:MAG: CpsD/CapB family tyrosine-protein kinase [Planctomycetota bacterium]
MGKVFEALKKAEKERLKLIKKAGADPSAIAMAEGEVDPHLVAYYDRMSPVTEQYRALKTNLATLHADEPPKAIVITSAQAGEGKTLTALNLAVTLADDKEARVVVVDGDMRTPAVHRRFGIDNQRGLSDYLSGSVMLEVVLQRSRLPNLSLLPSGRLPGNPGELLSSKKMADLLARLNRDFDHVIIDAPPVAVGTDAAILGAKADGAVLVVKLGETPREEVHSAVDLLEQSRVKLLGTVLTHLPAAVKDYEYAPAV